MMELMKVYGDEFINEKTLAARIAAALGPTTVAAAASLLVHWTVLTGLTASTFAG